MHHDLICDNEVHVDVARDWASEGSRTVARGFEFGDELMEGLGGLGHCRVDRPSVVAIINLKRALIYKSSATCCCRIARFRDDSHIRPLSVL